MFTWSILFWRAWVIIDSISSIEVTGLSSIEITKPYLMQLRQRGVLAAGVPFSISINFGRLRVEHISNFTPKVGCSPRTAVGMVRRLSKGSLLTHMLKGKETSEVFTGSGGLRGMSMGGNEVSVKGRVVAVVGSVNKSGVTGRWGCRG